MFSGFYDDAPINHFSPERLYRHIDRIRQRNNSNYQHFNDIRICDFFKSTNDSAECIQEV